MVLTGAEHLFDGKGADEWVSWRDGRFVELCVLAGSDYLSSLPNVGIRSAHAALRKHRELRAALSHAKPGLKDVIKLGQDELDAYIEKVRM